MGRFISYTFSLLVTFSVTFSAFAAEKSDQEVPSVISHSMTELPVPSFGSQEASSSQPLTDLLGKWKCKLEALPSEATRDEVEEAFQSASQEHPEALRSPLKIDGQSHYFPHGVSPQKNHTPRRKQNAERLARGEPPIFVNPCTDEIEILHGHHVAQSHGENYSVVYIPGRFHQGESRLLHRFNAAGSQINRDKFRKQKREVRKELGKRLHVTSSQDISDEETQSKVHRTDSSHPSSCLL